MRFPNKKQGGKLYKFGLHVFGKLYNDDKVLK